MTRPYRLPPRVRPRRYDVHVTARVGDPTFHGSVRIELDVRAPTRAIELHARDLDLERARLEVDGRAMEATPAPDPEAEMVALRLPEEAPAGFAVLHVEYRGKVSANMEGLYLSRDGKEACLATQCEETDARAIFPCFDEPAFKARIAWKVTTDAGMTVLANGRLMGVQDEGAMRTWTFEPTKPISSYLAALVIGPLASTSERHVEGVPLRVWAVQGKQHLGEYAQDFTQKLLPWYNHYFGVPYHFDKYDQVAVPSFAAGAMENAGLVVFRQSLLLRDPRTTSWAQEKTIARVIAHEFAHMWFGNLVTMDWWDDIWLNESFAEWMAHKAVDAVAPEYRIWEDFHAERLEALQPDALESTHPIYSPVETPQQATELFDAITYNKGSALMRMVERFLGEDAFREGLRSYMREFAERNARGADLWRHLEAASSLPVARTMESWILQGGYPVVSARLDGTTLRLSQRRFLSSPKAKPSRQTWLVPLVVRHADDRGVHETRHLLDAREGRLRLDVQGKLRWCHLNADGIGFYRQDLDAGLQARLVEHFGELSPPEQMDALDDAWSLVRSGARDVAAFPPLLDVAMRRAGSHNVLAQVVEHLADLEDLLEESGDAIAVARFRAWVRRGLRKDLLAVGLEPRASESRDASERRVSVLTGLAGLAHDDAAVAAARRLADMEAVDPASVHPSLAGPAVGLAAKFGDGARFDRHLSIYQARRAAGASPQETQRYLYSLASFQDPALQRRALDLMRGDFLPLEAIGPMLRLMLQRRHSRVAAWEHMKSDWRTIRERLGDMWTGFLVENTGHLPPRLRGEVKAFFDANLQDVARQARARALEALAQRAELEARTRGPLVAWFRDQPA